MKSERTSFGLVLVGFDFGAGMASSVISKATIGPSASSASHVLGCNCPNHPTTVFGPNCSVAERPGCRNGGPPGTIWTAVAFTPSAERSAIASRLASKMSTSPPPLQFRPSSPALARPRRTAAAAIRCSFSPGPRNTCPTSNSATSLKPRRALRSAAATRPAMRLGRMSERSAAIGLASASEREPPPNNSAAALETNDQVTASREPSAASVRLARRVRFCMSVSTGFGTPSSSRGRGAGGARSTPAMRRICSTTSALTWMSGRQEGTKARPSSTPKPSRRRIASPSSRGISTPSSRFTSLYWKGTDRRGADGSPATIMRDGSPPQIESTNSVARSQPGTQKSGSTPRSNR